MEYNLKPCPFCGFIPKLPSGQGTQYELWCECGQSIVAVQICDLMSHEEHMNTDLDSNHYYPKEFIERAKQKVITMWNTRYIE